MTLVHGSWKAPGVDEVLPVADGILECVPTRRLVVDDDVVLPQPFAVRVASGEATVNLEPTGVDWCWMLVERIRGGITRYVAVPAPVPDADPLEYVDLVDVDPTTLDPTTPVVPAYQALINEKADADVVTSLAATVATKASSDALSAETAAREAALVALADSIDTAVEDAVEAHTPGMELGYAERTTNATSTATASGSLVSGLSLTVVGQGRPVDVELFVAGLYNSVPNNVCVAYVAVNGSATGGLTTIAVSQLSTFADSRLCKRRLVLADGVSYTFTVGIYGVAAGTTTLSASAFTPSFLSVTSR